MKALAITIAICMAILLTAAISPALATATEEITFTKVAGTITHEADPNSDPACPGGGPCDAFKITASFKINNNVDFVKDVSKEELVLFIAEPHGQICNEFMTFWQTFLLPGSVSTRTSKGKTRVAFKGPASGFTNGGPKLNVDLNIVVTVDTSKGTGVLKASGTADLSSITSSPLILEFLYGLTEASDNDLDSSCTSFNAKIRDSK